MNGVYTNLAKKRAEQSKEPGKLSSVPPLLEKPIAQQPQETSEPKKPLNRKVKEVRTLGTVVTVAAEAQEFDLNIEPYKKGTFLFTNEELYAIDDTKKDMKRRLDLSSTQYDIVRSAIHIIVEDYRQRGAESLLVQRIRKKKAP